MTDNSISTTGLQREELKASELRFPGFDAGGERDWIRWELFLHHEVRDVLRTRWSDTLLVLHRGTANPEAWSATLRAAGFPAPELEHLPVTADADLLARAVKEQS